MTRTQPKKVNPFTEQDDFLVAMMAEFGMSTNAIAAATHLTTSQVTYRTGKFGIKRSHYRNGQSLGAVAVMKNGHKWIGAGLEQELRQRLGVKEKL